MIEIYSSWTKGLPKDKEALKLLFNSKIINGIEMTHIDEVEIVKESGLKVSLHNIIKQLDTNIADPFFTEKITKNPNTAKIFSEIKYMDNPYLGIHLGFSIFSFFIEHEKINNHLKILPETPIELHELIIRNITILQQFLKYTGKTLILENMIYYDEDKKFDYYIDKYIEEPNKEEKKERILKFLKEKGNIIPLIVTEPRFIKGIIEDPRVKEHNINLLFDVSHFLITAKAKLNRKEIISIKEELENYLLIGKIRQIHINTPDFDKDVGLIDHHKILKEDKISLDVIEIAKKVIEKNKENISIITLEINTDNNPIEHAKTIIKQARLIKEKLNI
jgi:hypothetical protein